MGQVSIGDFTMFPNKKLSYSTWKPQMAIAKAYDKYYLCIRCTARNGYHSFDYKSVVLIRFEDNSVEKLTLTPNIEVSKKFKSSIAGTILIEEYTTYSYYELSESCYNKIDDKKRMKKIRITYTNGDLDDYIINTNYMDKLADGLYNSLMSVEDEDAFRKQNMNDVESGF